MSRCLTPIAVALVVGCSSSRSPVPPPTSVLVPIATAPDAPLPAVVEAPAALPAEIREPTEVACRIPGVAWTSDQLRLRPGGPRFARAGRVARATVVLPVVSNPSEAIAVVDDGLVLVRAVLALEDVYLYAPKPTALLGIVTPARHTELRWTGSTPGSVRVALDTKGVLRSPDPFLADIACTALAIVISDYDARASITRNKQLPKRDVITDGAALAPAPRATPVAELHAGIEVELVETRGAEARILTEHRSLVVSGWVSRKDLGPAARRRYSSGYGRLDERNYKFNSPSLMHCPSALSLFVELGAERVKVGVIHENSGFRVLEDQAEAEAWREIELPESRWLVMEKNARLLVEAVQLRACRGSSPGF